MTKYSKHLQGIGEVPAIKNNKLRIGDRLVYNFGYIYKIVGVRKLSEKSKVYKLMSEEDGELYDRRFMNYGLTAVVDENNKYIQER